VRQYKLGRQWITSPWLNISDAVVYTGVSEDIIRQAIADRRLTHRAFPDGPEIILHCEWLDEWLKNEAIQPPDDGEWRPGKLLSLARKPDPDGPPPQKADDLV